MEVIIKLTIENGKVVNTEVLEPEEKKVKEPCSNNARFFDGSCTGWTKDAEHNKLFLRMQENYANDILRSKGHLFLNEVYDMLGIPRTKEGQVVGWVYDKDNPSQVDFGLLSDRNSKFVNGYDNTPLLDFKVDGNIVDQLRD